MISFAAIVIGMAAAGAEAPKQPVYARKPWASPPKIVGRARAAPVVDPRATQALDPATAARLAPDAWPNASQSAMRKFLCDTQPKGLVFDKALCAPAR